ncbi:hypothetical protein [Polynucleobacter necessarius]|uniref:hypothetical protein n=1 Tax=Polynucleobacter necessarius TaxID=576610 RepID=UPI000E08DD87|nr:hypothetical protein [Polynucleobacter necessarius]HAT40036.1 hypothetical protein [Polynucleobacter sp.]
MIHSIQGIDPVEVLGVTGFYSDAVEKEIQLINQCAHRPMTFIRNSNPELGQSSSVRLGLESLKGDYDAL